MRIRSAFHRLLPTRHHNDVNAPGGRAEARLPEQAPRPAPAPAAKTPTRAALIQLPARKQIVKANGNVTRRLTQALAYFHHSEQTTLWSDVALRDDHLQKWQVHFYYQSGPFAEALQSHGIEACEVHIDFPNAYPKEAPTVRVVQPRLTNLAVDGDAFGIYGGALCLEFLHDWSPSLSEESLLAQLHYALAQASIEGVGAYTREESQAGEKWIRTVHTNWKPKV